MFRFKYLFICLTLLFFIQFNADAQIGQFTAFDADTVFKVSILDKRILINKQAPANITISNKAKVVFDVSDASLKNQELYFSLTPKYLIVNHTKIFEKWVKKIGIEGTPDAKISVQLDSAKDESGFELNAPLFVNAKDTSINPNKIYIINRAINQDYLYLNNRTYRKEIIPQNIVSNYKNELGSIRFNVGLPVKYSPFIFFQDLNNDGTDDFILSFNNAFFRGKYFDIGAMYLPFYNYVKKGAANKMSIAQDNEDLSFPDSKPKTLFHEANRTSSIDLNGDKVNEIIVWGEGYHHRDDTSLLAFARQAGLIENTDFGAADVPTSMNDKMYKRRINLYEIKNNKLIERGDLLPKDLPLSASVFGTSGDFDNDGDNDIIMMNNGVWLLENDNYSFKSKLLLQNEGHDFFNEGFQRRIGTTCPYLIDVNGDGFKDIVCSLDRISGDYSPARTVYFLNNKNKNFSFFNPGDLIPYAKDLTSDNFLNYVLSDIYVEDINLNGTPEIVLCYAKEFSTVQAETPFRSKQVYQIIEISKNGQIINRTNEYFDKNENILNISSKNGGNFFLKNIDDDPELEIIPSFALRDPKYNNDFPKEGWYGYWNDYTGFQYFDFVGSKYKIKRLGNIIGGTFDNDKLSINATFGNGPFFLHDLNKDGLQEILLTGWNQDLLLFPVNDLSIDSKTTEIISTAKVNDVLDSLVVKNLDEESNFSFSLSDSSEFIGITKNKIYLKKPLNLRKIPAQSLHVLIKAKNDKYKTFTWIERSFKIKCLQPKPKFVNTSFSICKGDSLKLSVTNFNSGDSLRWFIGLKNDTTITNAKTILDSGKVYLTKIDTIGCTVNSDTVQVIVHSIPNKPTLSRDAENNLVSNFNRMTWYKDGVKLLDTAQKIKPTANGIFTATTDQNGCISPMSEGYYYITNAVYNFTNEESFQITPNPTNGEMSINYKLRTINEVYISILDITGRAFIFQQKIHSGTKINIEAVPKGNYIVQIRDRLGKLILHQKIIKE